MRAVGYYHTAVINQKLNTIAVTVTAKLIHFTCFVTLRFIVLGKFPLSSEDWPFNFASCLVTIKEEDSCRNLHFK